MGENWEDYYQWGKQATTSVQGMESWRYHRQEPTGDRKPEAGWRVRHSDVSSMEVPPAPQNTRSISNCWKQPQKRKKKPVDWNKKHHSSKKRRNEKHEFLFVWKKRLILINQIDETCLASTINWMLEGHSSIHNSTNNCKIANLTKEWAVRSSTDMNNLRMLQTFELSFYVFYQLSIGAPNWLGLVESWDHYLRVCLWSLRGSSIS